MWLGPNAAELWLQGKDVQPLVGGWLLLHLHLLRHLHLLLHLWPALVEQDVGFRGHHMLQVCSLYHSVIEAVPRTILSLTEGSVVPSS